MCRKIMLLCDYAEQVKEYYDGKWWLTNEQFASEIGWEAAKWCSVPDQPRNEKREMQKARDWINANIGNVVGDDCFKFDPDKAEKYLTSRYEKWIDYHKRLASLSPGEWFNIDYRLSDAPPAIDYFMYDVEVDELWDLDWFINTEAHETIHDGINSLKECRTFDTTFYFRIIEF